MIEDFTELNGPYDEQSEFAYLYNKKFDITIIVNRKMKSETNNDFIDRVNVEINRRFDNFEENIREWNRFNSLSKKDKEKEILKDYHPYSWFRSTLSKSDKKELIERQLKYRLEIPKL